MQLINCRRETLRNGVRYNSWLCWWILIDVENKSTTWNLLKTSFIKNPARASVKSIYSQGIHSWFRLEACNHTFSSQIQTTKQGLRQKERMKELTKIARNITYQISTTNHWQIINIWQQLLTKNSTIFNKTSQTLHGSVKLSQACQIQKHARKQVQIIKRSRKK